MLPNDFDGVSLAFDERLPRKSLSVQEAHFHVALGVISVWIVALRAVVPRTAVEFKDPVLLWKKSVDKVLANLPLTAGESRKIMSNYGNVFDLSATQHRMIFLLASNLRRKNIPSKV